MSAKRPLLRMSEKPAIRVFDYHAESECLILVDQFISGDTDGLASERFRKSLEQIAEELELDNHGATT